MQVWSLDGVDVKARILRVAAELFHRQGMRATTPDQIIKASGAGKGQFYYYFKNKNFLVHAVLHGFLEALKAGTAPVRYDVTSWQELKTFFFAHIEFQRKFAMTRSCPIGTVGNEVHQGDELVRQDVNLILEAMKARLAAFFRSEKAKGRLSRDANPEIAADFCLAIVQGAMLLGKVNRDHRAAGAAVHEALLHLHSYIRPPQKFQTMA